LALVLGGRERQVLGARGFEVEKVEEMTWEAFF
jgi:hypothetical protein